MNLNPKMKIIKTQTDRPNGKNNGHKNRQRNGM